MVELSELYGQYEADTWGDDYLTQSFRLVLYGDGKVHRFMYYYRYTTNHGYDEEFWEGRYELASQSSGKEQIRLVGKQYRWGWEDWFKQTAFDEGTLDRTLRVHRQDDGHFGFSFNIYDEKASLRWDGDVTEQFLARFEQSRRASVAKHRKRAEESESSY